MRSKRSSKRLWMVLCGVVLCFVASLVVFNDYSFATTSDEVVETNLFGNFTDDGQGCGVYKILNLVIDILSMGVAIVGIIGVTIVGIQYLTAKDSEEKTRKAKNRMLEIVIGLVAYAVLFAAVQWLLPGGMMNKNCTTVTDEQLAQMKAKEKEKEQEKQKKEEEKKNDKKETKTKEETKKEKKETLQKEKAVKKCKERAAKVVRNDICNLDTGAEKIAETAKLLAWPANQAGNAYSGATSKYKKAALQVGTDDLPGNACSGFVDTVLKASGLAPDFHPTIYHYSTSCIDDYLKGSPNWKNIKKLEKNTPRPGDIAVMRKPCGCDSQCGGMGHTLVYIKDNGRIVTAQANYAPPRQYGYVTGGKGTYHNSSSYNIYRYVGN